MSKPTREKLKKLESELGDLNKWKELGLVPKSNAEHHEQEVASLIQKIEDEKDRISEVKRNEPYGEYVFPKRGGARSAYSDNPTLVGSDDSDSDQGGSMAFYSEESLVNSGRGESTQTLLDDDEEENPFSDRNRWRRGMLRTDSDEW